MKEWSDGVVPGRMWGAGAMGSLCAKLGVEPKAQTEASRAKIRCRPEPTAAGRDTKPLLTQDSVDFQRRWRAHTTAVSSLTCMAEPPSVISAGYDRSVVHG